MQPNGRRAIGRRLLRVRQVHAAASEPGWHVHVRDDGVACRECECVRGQPRVRRVHGRLRGRLQSAGRTAIAAAIAAAAIAAAVTAAAIAAAAVAAAVAAAAIATTSVAAAVAPAAVTTADVRLQHDARVRWQRHLRNDHLH